MTDTSNIMRMDREAVQAGMIKKNFLACTEFRKGNILCKEAREVMDAFEHYYRDFPSRQSIIRDNFLTWLDLKDLHNAENIKLFMMTLEDDKEITDDEFAEIIELMTTHRAVTVCQKMIDGYVDGSLDDPIAQFKGLFDNASKLVSQVDNGMVNTDSLAEIFDAEDTSGGLPWFSKGISEICHSVLKGRLIIIAAAVNAGKTSFVLNNVLHWLKHLEPGEKIAWLNNEEKTSKLQLRIIEMVLGLTHRELINKYCCRNEEGYLITKNKRHILDEQKLNDDIEKVLGFKLSDRLHFFDAHGQTGLKIENQLKKDKYRVVVFDMLDHVKFPTSNNPQADIEHKYVWARALASELDMTVVATSQVSEQGMNTRTPGQEFLKGSRNDKQGQADLILTVGANEMDRLPAKEGTLYFNRTIAAPKNKMINIDTREFKYADGNTRTVPLVLDLRTAHMSDFNDTFDDLGEITQ